ncbi:MAG TPA: discoidin domain-containing protein [Thermoanaerobaculia bacterium]|nr:discoidin domain-containing protein [Thermoanaerobaculia bacterium]
MLPTLLLAASLGLPGGNLLLGRPAEGNGLAGAPAATDGLLAAEGTAAAEAADAGRAVRLADPSAYLVVDLGEARPVGALLLQADAGDDYGVEGSTDGTSWSGLVRIEAGDASGGMRTRRAPVVPPREVRFLLVHAEGGDGTYAVGELAAYVQPPPSWSAPAAASTTPARSGPTEGDRLVAIRAFLAAAAALLLATGLVLRRQGRPEAWARVRDRALVALGLLSAAAFFGFGRLHGGRLVHVWDSFHYVVGVKYFPELGYTGLYEAALAAERAAGLLPPGTTVPLRNLATNAIETTSADDALARWPSRLGPRWEAFVTDVLWFRAEAGAETFRRILLDHGYNATPAWGVLGGLLARLAGPATDGSVRALALLDPLLLLGAWLLVFRAFGFRVACVALVFWGTSFPARFDWNGGSFLRMDWLAAAMSGVSLLKLRRPRLAGAALGLSTLLRLFPGALLLGLGAAALFRLARERRLEAVRTELHVAQGALLAAAVVLPLSLLAAGGFTSVRWSAWSELAANSRKHLATPLTNNVGLGTTLTWRDATSGRALVFPDAVEPWKGWKETKGAALREARPLRIALAAAFLAAVAIAFRSRPPWAATAGSAGLVFVFADLTCYYAAVLLLLALLHAEREEAGVVTSLLAAATGAVPFLLKWDDQRYALVGALVLAAFALLLALFSREEKPAPPPTPRASRRRAARAS